MTEHSGTNPRVGAGCTGLPQWLAVDRVLELVAAFTVAGSLIGLAAALAGVFHAPQVLLGSLIVTGIYGFKTRGRGMFPASVPPRWAHLILLVLVALFFRLPAYHYVLGGQDEGLYTNIAQHIDHTGGVAVHDVVAEKLTGTPYLEQYLQDNRLPGYPGLYLAGVYARSPGNTKLDFQFYDMFPVWIALFAGLFGTAYGVYALTFFAVLSILFFYRLALFMTQSPKASLVAGGLLALNPLHAFFSKFPVTEIPALTFSLIGFVLLSSHWLDAPVAQRRRWIYLSILAFLCLFTTRISGFIYLPFFVAIAIAGLLHDLPVERRHALQTWTVGIVIAYAISVIYGLIWSHSYSHDIYNLSFESRFGTHWKPIVAIFAGVGVLIWVTCGVISRKCGWRRYVSSWTIQIVNRWLGLAVLAALVLGLIRVYWLGWTSHYAGSSLDTYWHLSGHHWYSAGASSLWILCVFLGPPMVLSFLALVGKKTAEPRMAFLRLFVIGFFVFCIAFQWDTPYSPYYARYLLSELVPYLILFVVCVWALMSRGKARTLLSVVLGFSLVYSTALSAMQIGKNEDDGAYAALSRLVAPVDPDDVILLDTLHQQPNTSLVKTPLVYTFHRDVVTVGSKALSNHGYLAKLDSIYNDVFLVSPDPSAPAGFVLLNSVRFRPMTYAHNHSFPHRLVPAADVVLYLYRLDDPQIPLGQTMSFAGNGAFSSWLKAGWSSPENWGVWSDAKQATISIDPRQLPANAGNLILHLKVVGYVNPAHQRQRIGVSLNGEHVADYEITFPATGLTMRLAVPSTAWRDTRKLSITFALPDAASPKSLGRGGDTRDLAMGLVSMEVTKARSAPSTNSSKQAGVVPSR